ncbi:MAG: CGNR zinc finger domain-containing protein [Actinobacteria bacterium]|nr:CGNR zinc finger domain-containing protein [Actinomycetota bacterium]
MGGNAVEDLGHQAEGADAPGDLAVVEAFVNTVTYNWDEPAEERLADPPALDRWLREHGLVGDGQRVTDRADLDRAVALREALRELLHANHDEADPAADALELLEAESRRAPLAVAFGDTGHAALAPVGTGIDRAVAILLAIVFHAMHDGTWQRLKACRNDGCRWAFYDSSRNRSGRWCDMAVCGNRAKVRAYRERHG